MPSVYLSGGDPAAYGVPNATAPQIQQASVIIDAFLCRPEGLIWSPDAAGNPAYMAALPASLTFKSSGAIAPGVNVPVTLTGAPVNSVQPGTVLLLDAGAQNAVEACLVNSISGAQVTLATVQFSHAAACTMDLGRQIMERKIMPKSRPLTMLARTPVIAILGGRGRYGYGRRSNQNEYNVNDFNVLAALQRFGGPPIWELFDVNHIDVDPNTGNVWVPAGIMVAYYSDCEFSYVAGYSTGSLPADVKQACANIVNAIVNMPMNGNIMQQAAGDASFRRFEASYMDSDTKALLLPFRAKVFG